MSGSTIANTDEGTAVDDAMATTTYDRSFFQPPSAAQRLADARCGLDVFVGEVSAALEGHGELHAAQREHLVRIRDYVLALGRRFDVVVGMRR